MPDGSHDPYLHFNIQRRNLILISVSSIFYVLGRFEIQKISLLGNEANIGNPNVLYWIFYSLFGYFFWRFYSAFNDIGGWGKFVESGRAWVDNDCAQKLETRILSNCKAAVFTAPPYIYFRSLKSISFQYEFRDDDTNEFGSLEYVKGEEHFGKEIYHLRLWSYVHAMLNRSAFSTYIFPFLLSLSALILVTGFRYPLFLEWLPF